MKDLERYLDEIVDPTVADLEANRTSVRHMFLACVAVFHAVDYLAHPKSSRSLRQQFKKQSPEFAIVDAVAHAFKHVKTGNPGNAELRFDDVVSRPPAYFGGGLFGLSRYNDPHGGVTINQARDVDLYDVVTGAVTFLRSKAA